ncbi:hypothetical protein RclHR1_00860016 [Rhizophagus clarus]|uniref:Uncharacterized protein n=1 Tax=Rhizophagus clarus TaxID=94130 RepID=A0A2Z6S137_9GLOM|nr:hypothetical protein RclHR1_00860016 [Rhizophagus clarus]
MKMTTDQNAEHKELKKKVNRLGKYKEERVDCLKDDVDELFVQVKKQERTVVRIGNYVEQTGLEPGKELTDSSESSSSVHLNKLTIVEGSEGNVSEKLIKFQPLRVKFFRKIIVKINMSYRAMTSDNHCLELVILRGYSAQLS